jgi:hypothetical protein
VAELVSALVLFGLRKPGLESQQRMCREHVPCLDIDPRSLKFVNPRDIEPLPIDVISFM